MPDATGVVPCGHFTPTRSSGLGQVQCFQTSSSRGAAHAPRSFKLRGQFAQVHACAFSRFRGQVVQGLAVERQDMLDLPAFFELPPDESSKIMALAYTCHAEQVAAS